MPKSLAKFGVLIPVWFTVYLFSHGLGNDIYYEHLHITFWSVDILMSYTVFALLWIVLSPFRASCCDGGIFEVLFYFFPVGVWCTLYVAQEDIGAIIMALVFLIGLNYYFAYHSLRKYRQWPVPITGYVRLPLKFMRQRFFLATTSAFLVGSVLLILFNNGMEAKANYSSIDSRQPVSSDESYDYQSRILRLDNLCIEKWSKLSTQQRIDTLQILANIETDKLGIPSAVVSTLKITYSDSAFSDELNQIVLDPEMVGRPDCAEDCVKCLLWAVHAKYIRYLVDHTDFESSMANTAFFEKIRAYRDNYNNYIEPNLANYDAYATQPIIRDSTEFAESECLAIFKFIAQNEEGDF